MSLQNYCQKPVVRISLETNITEACRLMEQNNIGCLIAEREGKLCGIVMTETSRSGSLARSAIPTRQR